MKAERLLEEVRLTQNGSLTLSRMLKRTLQELAKQLTSVKNSKGQKMKMMSRMALSRMEKYKYRYEENCKDRDKDNVQEDGSEQA